MLIAVSNLRHTIAGRTALHAPDFTLGQSEHLLLLGPSGSGKTTLVHLLAGLLTPSQGAVDIDGQPMSKLPPARRDALRKATIGVVFQSLRLIPALTVRQNVALAQQLALGREDPAAVAALLDRVDLEHKADARPRTLSQGEAQRAALARALAGKPKLVLADEPTSSLDDAHADAAVDLLLEAAGSTGASLVIATHDARIRDRFERTLELTAPDRARRVA